MVTNSSYCLAMDFGTSNSLVGFVSTKDKQYALPIDPKGSDPSIMRSLVYFANENEAFYGAEAIEIFLENDCEGRLFRSFKSHLPNSAYLGTLIGRNRRLPLEELVGLFILQLKKRSEKFLGRTVDHIVLGRPARYSMDAVNDSLALHRMTKAIEFAGFKTIHFVPEPLAAAFNFRRENPTEKIVLIGDFGGGTSDFTLIQIGPFAFEKNHVLAIEGFPMAGDALDALFMSHDLNKNFGAQVQYRLPMSHNLLKMPPTILERLNRPAHVVHLKERETYDFIQEILKVAIRNEDRIAINKLLCLVDDNQIFSFFEQIEKTKQTLSSENEADFHFCYPGIDIDSHITRLQFESWSSEFKSELKKALDRCFTSAQIKPHEVDIVCLTGGTAYVPFIRKQLSDYFGADKLQASSNFHSVQQGLVEAAGFILDGVTF